MKKHSIITSALLMMSIGAVNAASVVQETTNVQIVSEGSNLTSKQIDALGSRTLYWQKMNAIETARNSSLLLQIQNKNLDKVINNTVDDAEEKNDGVANIQEFINLSLGDSGVLDGDSVGQEGIILNNSDTKPLHNMEIVGTVDSRGNIIDITSEKQDKAASDIQTMQDQQKAFFEEMSAFVNDRFAEQNEIDEAKAEAAEAAEVSEVKAVEAVEAEKKKAFSYAGKDIEKPVFYPPTGKIKRVTTAGVEIVVAFEHLIMDDDTVFVTALIKEGDTEVVLHPAVRYQYVFKIEEYSDRRIVLISPFDERIIVTR